MKVSIVGYSPTRFQAPIDDPAWEIWGLNHRFKYLYRFDKWFDLHNISRYKQCDYYNFLKENEHKLVICSENEEKYPNAIKYPQKEIMEMFGTDCFSNSVSWMIAYAIYLGAEEIGLWGIDLETNSEYEFERPSVFYFIKEAMDRGIKITVPDNGRLLRDVNLDKLNKEELLQKPFKFYWNL